MAAAQASGQSTGTGELPVTLFSPKGGQVKTSGGLEIATQPISEAASLDLLVIAAIWRDPRRVIKRHPELIPFIAKLVNQGSSIAAVGTGSFLLAETGLLDKKPATTHWFWLDEFASRYPAVDLRRDELIVQSDNLYCAGSVNSISDLLVYLMGNFYNTNIARHVENQFSPEIRRRFKSTQLGFAGYSRASRRGGSGCPDVPAGEIHPAPLHGVDCNDIPTFGTNLNAPLPARRGHYTMAVLAQPTAIRGGIALENNQLEHHRGCSGGGHG